MGRHKRIRKIKVKSLLEKIGLNSFKVSAKFIEAEFKPTFEDEDAAWELYTELLTRIAIRPLPDESGDELSALNSVYSIFVTTRMILKQYGRKTVQFSKVAIVVLNQVIRPFTTKWHTRLDQNSSAETKQEFRNELKQLQIKLVNYTKILAEIANVEDITNLEEL